MSEISSMAVKASRESFLSKSRRRFKEISFEGEVYRIQSLTERERVQYDLQLQDKKTGRFTDKSLEKMRRLFVVKVLVDDSGNRIFTDEEEELLKDIDGRLVSVLYETGQGHCGYDKADVEDIVKNLDPVAG